MSELTTVDVEKMVYVYNEKIKCMDENTKKAKSEIEAIVTQCNASVEKILARYKDSCFMIVGNEWDETTQLVNLYDVVSKSYDLKHKMPAELREILLTPEEKRYRQQQEEKYEEIEKQIELLKEAMRLK